MRDIVRGQEEICGLLEDTLRSSTAMPIAQASAPTIGAKDMAKLQRQLEEATKKIIETQKDVAERAALNASATATATAMAAAASSSSSSSKPESSPRVSASEMRAVSEELLRAKAELKSLEKQREDVSTLKADNMSLRSQLMEVKARKKPLREHRVWWPGVKRRHLERPKNSANAPAGDSENSR